MAMAVFLGFGENVSRNDPITAIEYSSASLLSPVTVVPVKSSIFLSDTGSQTGRELLGKRDECCPGPGDLAKNQFCFF